MAKKITVSEEDRLSLSIVRQMLSLATSGFGLVAALAWNEAIKTFINSNLKPFLGNGSGILSLLVYAVVVTVLAVTVTYQLAKLQRRLERQTEEKTK